MKKIILAVIVSLFIAVQCEANITDQIRQVLLLATGGACATPDNGDELDEGFIGAGYEQTTGTWTESAGTVDEDATLTGQYSADDCTEGLNVVASAAKTYAYWDKGSTIAAATNIDFYVDFYIDAITVDDGTYMPFISWDSDTTPASAGNFEIQLGMNSGVITVRASGTGAYSGTVTLSLDTWYRVHIHHDATAASSYMTIDGGAQKTFTRVGANCRYLFLGPLDDIGSGESADIDFGYVYINTP